MTQPRSDKHGLCVLAHVSAFIWLLGIPGVVGPLVMWLVYRQDPEVEPHAREALNFHLSMVIYGLCAVALGIILVVSIIGLLLIPVLLVIGVALVVAELVLTIVGAVAASRGELYRYPLTVRLIV